MLGSKVKDALQRVTYGDRIELVNHNNFFGTVRFVGTTHFATVQSGSGSIFYGIELDKMKGKNDGSKDNIRYFHCAVRHGCFVKLKKLTLVESFN